MINDGNEVSVQLNIVPCNIYFLAAFCSHYRCACNLLSCTYTLGDFLKIRLSYKPDPNFGGVKIVSEKLSEKSLLDPPSPDGAPCFINFSWLTTDKEKDATANQHVLSVMCMGRKCSLDNTYAKREEMDHNSNFSKFRRAFF